MRSMKSSALWMTLETDSVITEKCLLCGSTSRPGQVILLKYINGVRIVQHKSCLRVLMSEAPLDESDFAALKDRIVETGDFFLMERSR